MSSLDSKIEDTKLSNSNKDNNNESKKSDEDIHCKNDELKDDYIECSICNEAITKDTYKRMSVKPKGKKSYSRYDICTTCQNKTHLCPNNCGTPLSAPTWIKGHHKILCDREYRKSHPHTDKDAKIAELQNQLENITTDRNYFRNQAEYWKKMYKHNDEDKKYILTPQLKHFVDDLIRQNVRNRLIYNCNDCRPCIEYYSHKHTCEKCKLCKNCDGKVTIYDHHISLDCSNEIESCSNELNSLE